MAEPRFLTYGEYQLLGGSQVATVTLTNDQIKASPEVVVMVPATEVLDYSGFPSTLYLPIYGFAYLDARGGAYGDVVGTTTIDLYWGSDRSFQVGTSGTFNSSDPFAYAQAIQANATRQFFPLIVNGGFLDEDDLEIYDNALCVVVNNALTGGNAANTMRVTVYYTEIELT